MEVGVRLVGILLRILYLLLMPVLWLLSRDNRKLPPIRNRVLRQSVSDLAAAIRSGELTSEQLVNIYVERVNEVNPYLNAVVEDRFRDALDDAKAVDKQITEARENGTFEELVKDKPLLGVPFTVKESCSLAGMSNSVGCLEHAGRRATADGALVSLIKKAGAIPLLVSNTPELCLGWETTNLLHGTTNNPYCLNRTPGGSSGGEAALLASGASPFSVASDIAGSIRLPAAFCGVFGHKPTPGIIPIEGHIPTLSDEQFPKFLTTGPMTRTADDLLLLTKIMCGEHREALRLDEPVDMKDIKVHYMLEAGKSIALLNVDQSIQDAILRARDYLKDCGATISEVKFKDLEDSVELSVSEFFSMKDIPNLLQDPADPKKDKSLAMEVLKLGLGGGSRSLQALGFSLIGRTRLFIPDARTAHYKRLARRLRDEMTMALGAGAVLLYPAHALAAHAHGGVFLAASGVLYCMALNVLGLPATVAPLGRTEAGLPVAIQIIAAPGQDRLCLAVAKQLEVGFGGWKPPE